MKYYFNFKFPIGTLFIVEEDNKLIKLTFEKQIEGIKKKTNLIAEVIKQLNEYFNKQRKVFDLPITLTGTSFQKKVYYELLKIKYNNIKTYQNIAINIKNKNYSRAVGNACNKNPICIIVPCHRVIGKNNQLTGYAYGLNIKEQLLALEKRN